MDNIINYGRVTEDAQGNFICVDAGYEKLPVLCPFLSKTPDNSPDNDGSLAAFHGSITDWTMADTLATQVVGRLAKSDNDIEDDWIIFLLSFVSNGILSPIYLFHLLLKISDNWLS